MCVFGVLTGHYSHPVASNRMTRNGTSFGHPDATVVVTLSFSALSVIKLPYFTNVLLILLCMCITANALEIYFLHYCTLHANYKLSLFPTGHTSMHSQTLMEAYSLLSTFARSSS